MSSKTIGVVRIQFDPILSGDCEDLYARKISLLQIDGNHNTLKHEIVYPSIERGNERKKNGSKHVRFENSNSVKFINILCELTNTSLGELLHKYTHLIVESHVEESFLKEFVTETTKIIVLD